MAHKVFCDTNIIVDFIEQRQYDLPPVNQLFLAAEENRIDLYLTESVLVNALYITRKEQHIYRLLSVVNFIHAGRNIFRQALASSFTDKEDAILYFAALENKMQAFITRNEKDFKKHSTPLLPVFTPSQFLKNFAL